MNLLVPSAAPLFILAGGITALSVVLSCLLMSLGTKDIPNARSSHQQPVSRNGGVAIVLAFYGGLLVGCLTGDFPLSPLWFDLLCLSAVMAVMGLADDLFGLPYKTRIAIQCAVAVIATLKGLHLQSVILPFAGYLDLGALGNLLSVVWLVGVMNAYNFMDGLNGLAVGVILLLCMGMGMLGLPPLMLFCLFFALLGFFILNFPYGRIFLGDAGSQFLGFIIGALLLRAMMIAPASSGVFLGPILLFAFLWDTILTLVRRLKRGEHVFTAHREHLYQLLNRSGWSHPQVSVLHFFFASVQLYVAYRVLHEGLSPSIGMILLGVGQGLYTLMVFRRARRAGVLV